MSAPRRPTIEWKTFHLGCSALRPLEGKTLQEIAAVIKDRLIRDGADPDVEPVLYGYYSDWQMRVPAPLTDEKRAEWKAYQEYQDREKRRKAIASIRKIAPEQGIVVTVEGP